MIVKDLLRLLKVVKPDTVKEMKHIGLCDEVRGVIDALSRLAVSAQQWRVYEDENIANRRAWVKVWGRLAELRTALEPTGRPEKDKKARDLNPRPLP